MDEDLKDTMSTEHLKASTREVGPEYNTQFSVSFSPEYCSLISVILNNLVVYEVGKGIRSEISDRENGDALDRLQEGFMVGAAKKEGFRIPISESNLDFVEAKFVEYATAKRLNPDELADQGAELRELRARLRGSNLTAKSKIDASEDFGTGPHTLLGRWLRKRGENGLG